MTRTHKVVFTALLWALLSVTGIALNTYNRIDCGGVGVLMGLAISLTIFIWDTKRASNKT